ncbi:response regulator [Paraglaciecola hydrolytica]|uniref:histidine kinase n=1 Tax=Paraglaciecola hydrolytica TaxID=1799789 RepID=A0A148KL54_9ALTE|nr:response regulator [Paraglaciecola hydrolytica]KXI27033.1 hypothetical protein AX660_02065 [Paraglaciecola hydrolytica]
MGKKIIWLVVFSVFFSGAGIYLGIYEKDAIETRNTNKVAQSVDEQAKKIASEIHASVLRFQFGLRALLGAIDTTGFDNFTYAKQLKYFKSRNYALEFPGARGFGLIKLVKSSDLDDFVKSASDDRGQDFTIKQLDSPKDPLFIIQYIEPEADNNSAIGLDIGSESNRRIAALQAAKLGELQLTGPITLVQANDKENHGFLLLYPIYKPSAISGAKDVLGWVYAPLLIDEILDTVSAVNNQFSFQISDKTGVDDVSFYTSFVPEDSLQQYQITSQKEMFGRDWAVTVVPSSRFLSSLALQDAQNTFWQIIIGTLSLNILVIFTTFFLSARVVKLKQQLAFNSVVNNASDGIIGVDNNFAIQHWNQAASQLFAFTKNKVQNKPIANWLTVGIASEKLIDYFKKVATGETLRNIKLTLGDETRGPRRELLIHISPIYQKNVFSGATVIFNDVTETKELQNKLELSNVMLEKRVADSTLELTKRNNLQKSILDSNQAIIIACDKTGLISLFNVSAEILLNYSATEVLGKINVVKLLDRQMFPIELPKNALPEDFLASLSKVLSVKDDFAVNCSFKTKKSSLIGVKLIVNEFKDTDDTLEGYMFTATDQREKQGLENHMSLIGAAIDNSQDFLFWLSLDGNIINANPFAKKELESVFTSQLSTVIADILVFSSEQSWSAVSTQLVENRLFTFEADIKFPQKRLPVIVSGCVIEINGLQIIYLAAKSIVERLEKEKEIQSALIKAELANNAKTKFIANMSHELRTPLNAAQGYLQLLALTKVNEIQRNHIIGSQKAIVSLTHTIDEILEATDAEKNHLKLEQCDFVLDELLNEIGMLLYEMSGDKTLEIHFNIAPDTPYTLYGDRKKLKKILINIASNAVKFTDKGEVLINLAVRQLKNQYVKLDVLVKDTGIGIEAENLGGIFDTFNQVNNESTREYGGLGIGLTVANKYVNFLGGKIAISSQIGTGTEVRFDVTMQQARQTENTKLVFQFDKIVNVLLVDDNRTSLRILSDTIKQFGWKVTVADNAADALVLYESAVNHDEPFDLALIDWKMPNTDGWELAALFRKVTTSDKMPLLIMVTTHSKEMFAQKQENAPNLLNGFLTKPVTRIQLLEAFYDAVDSVKPVDLIDSSSTDSNLKPLLEMRILVVDDNPINLTVAKSLLESQGANIVTVNGGKEALFELENSLLLFDLVLMDIQMPVMDGYETTRRIRAIDKFIHLPIIAMTANVLSSDKEKCLKAGMNEHIGKPIELNDMLNKILAITNQSVHQTVLAETPVVQTDIVSFCDKHKIDFKNAMALFNNLESVYLKTLILFRSDLLRYIEQLENASTSHNDLKMTFHTLKSTAATFGFIDLTDFAKEQEKIVLGITSEDFDIVQFQSNIDTLKDALQKVNTLITLLGKDEEQIDVSQENECEFDKEYAQLKDEISNFNMHAIDTFQTIACPLKSLSPALADQLISAINKLKFQDANEILLKIDELIGASDDADK